MNPCTIAAALALFCLAVFAVMYSIGGVECFPPEPC